MKDNEFFSSSLNGYNKKEVIGYLEKLNRQADEVEARHRTEVEALRTELEALSKERERFRPEAWLIRADLQHIACGNRRPEKTAREF